MVYIYTDTLILQMKNCAVKFCPGDSGEAMCIFCPKCVLSVAEVAAMIREARGE